MITKITCFLVVSDMFRDILFGYVSNPLLIKIDVRYRDYYSIFCSSFIKILEKLYQNIKKEKKSLSNFKLLTCLPKKKKTLSR